MKFRVTAAYNGNCKDYPDYDEIIEADNEDEAEAIAMEWIGSDMFYSELSVETVPRLEQNHSGEANEKVDGQNELASPD